VLSLAGVVRGLAGEEGVDAGGLPVKHDGPDHACEGPAQLDPLDHRELSPKAETRGEDICRQPVATTNRIQAISTPPNRPQTASNENTQGRAIIVQVGATLGVSRCSR